ncbi:sensor histidine kinase [Anaerosphaera multitolerans]|uniref:histidine kinase n=2 Tax=Anaerosphaera multitolerans TaxID=2487351 RepID=A0A437S7D9_9FIRM|nr:HAMP domain-containing sensor histidine kinase [Anaerosphaera multitolerans]RVU54848.1 sensor histidine kinase [Anaerosphaera multitolerans]
MFAFWKYFSGFAAAILISLWLFQIVFLNMFYESMKEGEVTKIGNYLLSEADSKDFEKKLSEYFQVEGTKVQVIDEEGHLIYPLSWIEMMMHPKILKEKEFNEYFDGVKDGEKPYRVFTTQLKNEENPTIIYAGYLGKTQGVDRYLMIQTDLEPVDSAVGILQKLLMIVSIMSLILALILSYFISKKLSGPLVRMSKTAKILGSGNFEVHFSEDDYSEINDLSNTLNYATSELEKTMEMRKDLISNVSHDLKTPLTVIKSYGEMIRDISGNNEEMRNRHIDTIIKEADHLTMLVNDLLDLSKIESDLVEVNYQWEDLSQITSKVMDRFKIFFEQNDYNFNYIVEGNCVIYCDSKRIEQVIYNLVNNAINYSKDEKELTIKIVEKDGKVEFHCIDKGVGIKKEHLKDIWDKFYRERDNHIRPEVGTGLGLYIVKSILEMHGFDYGVNSELGKGSDFYFIADAYKNDNEKLD